MKINTLYLFIFFIMMACSVYAQDVQDDEKDKKARKVNTTEGTEQPAEGEWGNDDSKPDYVFGDVNGDGVVNTSDAVMVLNYYLGKTKEINQKLADVNGDGVVNTSDAVAIINIYLNKK